MHPVVALENVKSRQISLYPPQYYLLTTLSELLKGSVNTLQQRAKVHELSSGLFGKMVLNPRALRQRDSKGRMTLTYEGDEVRGGAPGRMHRTIVDFGKDGVRSLIHNIWSQKTLMSNLSLSIPPLLFASVRPFSWMSYCAILIFSQRSKSTYSQRNPNYEYSCCPLQKFDRLCDTQHGSAFRGETTKLASPRDYDSTYVVNSEYHPSAYSSLQIPRYAGVKAMSQVLTSRGSTQVLKACIRRQTRMMPSYLNSSHECNLLQWHIYHSVFLL